ncbi:MAG TPA: phosphatase PAP2 family protein [Candidatus Saccharimonadales bacterium]|nr:phosphatase PAP2 family protein [Candidatus Saccharimonadales bacterium]
MVLQTEKLKKTKKTLSAKRRITLAGICLVAGILVFIAAYIGMKQLVGLGAFNRSILSWMVGQRSTIITPVAIVITTIANPLIFAIIVSALVIVWMIFKREIWRPVLLESAMGVAALTSFLIKNITQVPRPNQINMIKPFETDYSFPSGHTIGMAVFLLVIGYLIYSRNFSKIRFWSWIIAATAGTGLIALSRLYLGYHWLTDVVASVGLALIILAIVIIIDMFFTRRFKKLG